MIDIILAMATRKSSGSLEAIHAQIAKLEAQAQAIRTKEVGDVVSKIREAIKHYGLTAQDLGFGATRKVRSAGAKRPGRPAGKGAGRKKTTRAAKYADGQGNTWSGMGKRPNWFKEALASGKKPEELLANG